MIYCEDYSVKKEGKRKKRERGKGKRSNRGEETSADV